jgi:hypothetical protein
MFGTPNIYAAENAQGALDNEIFQEGYLDGKSARVLEIIQRTVDNMGAFYHDMYGFDVRNWKIYTLEIYRNEEEAWANSIFGKDMTLAERYEIMDRPENREKTLAEKIELLRRFIISLDTNAERNQYSHELTANSIVNRNINPLLYELDQTMRAVEALDDRDPMKQVFRTDSHDLDTRAINLNRREYFAKRGRAQGLSDSEYAKEYNDILEKTRSMRASLVGNRSYSSTFKITSDSRLLNGSAYNNMNQVFALADGARREVYYLNALAYLIYTF